jgi:SAM-dependent methyltransferase
LEHICNDDDVFREVHRVLKPGGGFVLSVPSNRLPYPMKIIARLPKKLKHLFAPEIVVNSCNDDDLRRNFDIKFMHIRRYDKESLIMKAHEAGFNVLRIRYNLKFFGDLVNGIIHSLRTFDLDKKNGYKLQGNILHAIFFPVFYVLHRLDDLIPVTGCTIVIKLYKN